MPVTLGAPPQHGFDEPLALLSDCHRRIEMFLGVLRKVAQDGRGTPLSNVQRSAVESALTYFDVAGPRHTADEEQSLFPLLRACFRPEARIATEAIDTLEADHRDALVAHQEVESLYRRWIDSGSLTDEQASQLLRLLGGLTQMYQRHIEVEDKRIFPLAGSALGHDQIAALGREMAGRRGINLPNHLHPQPNGETSMTTTSTIDVRTIPGPQRHPIIFQTFEDLATGEALEITNDHDPFPLQNQFNMLKRGQFSWDYLEQGPSQWRVRIGRIGPPKGKA